MSVAVKRLEIREFGRIDFGSLVADAERDPHGRCAYGQDTQACDPVVLREQIRQYRSKINDLAPTCDLLRRRARR